MDKVENGEAPQIVRVSANADGDSMCDDSNPPGTGAESHPITQAGSSLLARRTAAGAAALLPKLKNIRRARPDSAETDCNTNEPDLDFVYGDEDTVQAELSEIYTYSEMNEFATNYECYKAMLNRKKMSTNWSQLSTAHKNMVASDMLGELELADSTARLAAARALLYVLQGAFHDLSVYQDKDHDQLSAMCLRQAYVNAHILMQHGAFTALCTLLCIELEHNAASHNDNYPSPAQESSADRSRAASKSFSESDQPGARSGRRGSNTIADNEDLRVVLAALCSLLHLVMCPADTIQQIMLSVCHTLTWDNRTIFTVIVICLALGGDTWCWLGSWHIANCDSVMFPASQKAAFRCNRDTLKELMLQPIYGKQTLTVLLLQMVSSFCAGTTPHYPMKKVLIVLWKSILYTLGGWEELRTNKERLRVSHGLGVCQDTLTTAKHMKAAPPPTLPTLLAAARENMLNDGDRAPARAHIRPALPQRQLAYCGGSDEKLDFEPSNEEGLPDAPAIDDSEDEVMIDLDSNEPKSEETGDSKEGANVNDEIIRADSPVPFATRRQTEHCGKLTRPPTPAKILPWVPKIRECDVNSFLQNERAKFFDFSLPGDTSTVIGLPLPIQKSYATLHKHVYVSLGDAQASREVQYKNYPFSQRESSIELTAAEQLYRSVVPHIPQYMIALLKILLAAVPSSKAKSDTFNILCDVVTGEVDSNVLMSLSGSSFSLDPAESLMAVDQCARIATDIHRHKEIIVKSISSILLLLLKHLRLNHIYQFEHLAQHLVYANCIPLILKFFDHNIVPYVQSRNDMPLANYPNSVVYWAQNNLQWPDYTGDLPDFPFKSKEPSSDHVPPSLQTQQSTHVSASRPAAGYFLWRNLYSSINLLRVVNKLTKWKHARTMMLVVFKSAPILKRTLRVKHILLQLYALKLLKMQAKYLGRQWRKSNMEIMSAIYSKVRHRLNDDWAFGNETQSKPWDFQSEESELRCAVEAFNQRRYAHILAADRSLRANHDANQRSKQQGPVSGSAASRNVFMPSPTQPGALDLVLPVSLPSSVHEPDMQPYDHNLQSVLGHHVLLSERFQLNYETWLQREVYTAKIDWNLLLQRHGDSELPLQQTEVVDTDVNL